MIAHADGRPRLTLVRAVCRPPGPATARRGRTRSLRIDLAATHPARLRVKSHAVIFKKVIAGGEEIVNSPMLNLSATGHRTDHEVRNDIAMIAPEAEA
jgi:hypothetical protein